MKKLINLIALVMLVSTNVLTPLSYAQVETPEVIPENEMENAGESGETPEYMEDFLENVSNDLGELEQENQEDETSEDVDIQYDMENSTTDETEEPDTESNEVVQSGEETPENEIQDEGENFEELEKVEESVVMSVIPDTTVTLLPGQEFNSIIKTLANGGAEVPYTGVDNNIQSFQRVDVEIAGVTTGEISVAGSEYPVHAWFSGGILYYATQAATIQLNEDSQSMFQGFSGLTGLDLSNFDTSDVTNMNFMFSGCENVEYLNLDNWDLSNISNYNMGGFKRGTPLLKKISMRGWKIPEVFQDKMGRTWGGANNSLEEIDVTNWDLSNAKNLRGLFAGATSLKIIKGLDTWDTSNIINMSEMFYQCYNLEEINVSNRNTSKVTNMYEMFRDCDKLEELDLRHFDVSNVTNMGEMFQDCNNLKILNLESRDVGSVVNIRNIIHYCNNLEELNLSGWDFRNIGGERLFTSNLSSYDLSKLKKLNLTNTKFSGSMERAFSGIPNVEEIKFDGIDTSNVTNMSYMFVGCRSLTGIDVSSFDTSNVTNMSYMFESCKKLENLDLSILNTSNVTGMDNMFKDCTGLVNLNLSGWDFRKVGSYSLMNRISLWSSPLKTLNMTNAKFSGSMQQAFQGLGSKNVNLVLDNIDTSNVTSMNQMFQGCEGLTGLNISGWDTRNVTDMSLMFQFCSGLHSLDVSSLDVSKVTNMYGMFYGCSGLVNLDINNLNTSNVTNMGAMFYGCNKLESLKLDNWDLSNNPSMGGFISNTPSLKYISMSGWIIPENFINMIGRTWGYPNNTIEKINVNNWNLSKTKNIQGLFGDARNLKTIEGLETWDTSGIQNMEQIFNGDYKLENLNLSGWYLTGNMTYMFGGLNSLKEINLDGVNTKGVTNMSSMFNGCSNLTGLDLSNWDLSNIREMNSMFVGCTGLENLNLDNWNLSNNPSMGSLISNTPSLKYISMSGWIIPENFQDKIGRNWGYPNNTIEKINVNNWDLSKTKYIQGLFGDIKNLKTIEGLESWDTSNIENMNQLFFSCGGLTGLNLSNFDTSNVTNMGVMFYGCTSLINLDLSRFDTSKVQDMNVMFYNTPNLKTIYASEKFVTAALSGDTSSKDMFSGTTSVVGGNGTKFDPNYIDKTYAKIDKVGQTGYFTDKNAITVKFINTLDGTETISTFAKGQKLTPPSVDKYHVAGGYLDEAMTQEIDLNKGVDSYTVIYVKYDHNGSSGGGGGGGGGSTKPDTPKDEQQPADTSDQIPQNNDSTSSGAIAKDPENDSSEQLPQNDESNTQDSSTSSQNDTKTYSTEFQQAYEFAKGNGITTMPTIQKANMEGKLTRIAMAKMLSQYAINVLGKTPDTSKTVKFKDVTSKKDADYDNGVTLAYQLGIMGQNMPGNNFRPNDEVTRAEFATALSRMAYNTSDGEYKSTSKYYIHHMEKLVNEGIITNDNPNMKELRGYVMIMLMRSAK